MQTILVTGSNGLLGQKLLEKILDGGEFNLVATSRNDNRYPVKEGYVFFPAAIEDTAALTAAIDFYRPDAVIHTAALTNADFCEQNPEECNQVNVSAVAGLSRVCAQNEIQLVFISTDFIFDGQNGPYSESSVTNPLNIYGESKVAAENCIRASGSKWVILRTILVYGIIPDRTRTNIVLWVKNSLEQGVQINVVNDQWRMATLVDDLADACLLSIKKKASGIYHISGSSLLSIAQMAYAVADHWGLDRQLISEISATSLSAPASRPVSTGFILDKAIDELGYRPSGFKDGLVKVAAQLAAQTVK